MGRWDDAALQLLWLGVGDCKLGKIGEGALVSAISGSWNRTDSGAAADRPYDLKVRPRSACFNGCACFKRLAQFTGICRVWFEL